MNSGAPARRTDEDGRAHAGALPESRLQPPQDCVECALPQRKDAGGRAARRRSSHCCQPAGKPSRLSRMQPGGRTWNGSSCGPVELPTLQSACQFPAVRPAGRWRQSPAPISPRTLDLATSCQYFWQRRHLGLGSFGYGAPPTLKALTDPQGDPNGTVEYWNATGSTLRVTTFAKTIMAPQVVAVFFLALNPTPARAHLLCG